jgi:hypothetical protein
MSIQRGLHKASYLYVSSSVNLPSPTELQQIVESLYDLVDEAKDWAKPTVDFTENSDSDTERDPESRPNSSELNSSSPRPSLAIMVSTTTVVEPAPLANPSHSTVVRRPSSTAPVAIALSDTEEQELRRVAKVMLTLDPEHIAEEITRGDLEMFMAIKVHSLIAAICACTDILRDQSRATGCATHTLYAATVTRRCMRLTKSRIALSDWDCCMLVGECPNVY